MSEPTEEDVAAANATLAAAEAAILRSMEGTFEPMVAAMDNAIIALEAAAAKYSVEGQNDRFAGNMARQWANQTRAFRDSTAHLFNNFRARRNAAIPDDPIDELPYAPGVTPPPTPLPGDMP